jgi:hypothetical protein
VEAKLEEHLSYRLQLVLLGLFGAEENHPLSVASSSQKLIFLMKIIKDLQY